MFICGEISQLGDAFSTNAKLKKIVIFSDLFCHFLK
jgi:hypothetical protein